MRHLGKLPAVPDPRVPALKAVLRAAEQPPADCNWWAPIGSWPLLGNDTVGDCVQAAIVHAVQQRRTYVGDARLPPTTDAQAAYAAWTGWNGVPNDATDQGTVLTDALTRWARDGISVNGTVDRLAGYAAIDHADIGWLKRAVWHCGSVLVGLNCPSRWLGADYVLDLVGDDLANIAGGHCVLFVGYEDTARGVEFDTITWGGRFRMVEDAAAKVIDEAYAVLDADFNDARGVGPDGIDWTARDEAMRSLA